MTPALFVEFGFKAFRLPQCSIIGTGVTPWTGSAAAAGAGVLALKGSIKVGFAYPAAVFAN